MTIDIYKKFNKNTAIDLRKKGLSYSEILKKISVPKSTLAFWLKDIKLEPNQSDLLLKRRSETAKANIEKRLLRTELEIENLKNISATAIKDVSKRELWLMGIMLYWRERMSNEDMHDIKNGLKFSSGDPILIKFFMKWLIDIGKIDDRDLLFDIFIKKPKTKSNVDNAVKYWSGVTGLLRSRFIHNYSMKSNKAKKGASNISDNGFLRIRVSGSTMLARQISGWIRGIQNSLRLRL